MFRSVHYAMASTHFFTTAFLFLVIHLINNLLLSGQSSRTTGGNQTGLLPWNRGTRDTRGMTNVLVVTPPVWMLNWVHRHTADLWPTITFNTVLVVCAASFQKWFGITATTSDQPNHSTASVLENFLGARWKTHDSRLFCLVVTNNGAVHARGLGNFAAITNLLFDLAYNGPFRAGRQGQHVADSQLGFLPAVHKLSTVHTFSAHELFGLLLVVVGISELNNGERGATTRVMNDVLDDTFHESTAFGIIQRAEFGGAFAVLGVRPEDAAAALSLRTNYTTHIFKRLKRSYTKQTIL